MPNRRTVLQRTSAVAALGLAGCASLSGSNPTTKSRRRTLQVGSIHGQSHDVSFELYAGTDTEGEPIRARNVTIPASEDNEYSDREFPFRDSGTDQFTLFVKIDERDRVKTSVDPPASETQIVTIHINRNGKLEILV